MNLKLPTVAALAAILTIDSPAGPIRLFNDINGAQVGAAQAPSSVVDLNGTGLFFFADRYSGVGLWRTDGTAAGTYQLKNLRDFSGSYVAYPEMVRLGNAAYFPAKTPAGDEELWRTDGTAGGTALAVETSANGGFPYSLTVMGGSLYFLGWEGTDLFLDKTDGTQGGTVRLKTFPNAAGGSLGVLGSSVIAAVQMSASLDLWKTDGTVGGTSLITSTAGINLESAPERFLAVGSNLYFAASAAGQPAELWKTDGTAGGTRIVRDAAAAPTAYVTPLVFAAFNGKLFFIGNDTDHGMEIWSTDGTPAGTQLFRDAIAGPTSGVFQEAMRVWHGKLLFTGYDGVWPLIWQSDGSIAGTAPLHAIHDSWAIGATADHLYFNGGTLATTGFCRSDGSNYAVLDANLYPSAVFQSGGRVCLFEDSAGEGWQLWTTDGTPAGTVSVTSLQQPPPQGSSNPRNLTLQGNSQLFAAVTDEAYGESLVRFSSGSNFAYFPGKNFVGSGPTNLVAATNRLFFGATDLTRGTELWSATSSSAALVSDIKTGAASSNPQNMTALPNGSVLFSAEHPTAGRELFIGNASGSSATLLKDINPGSAGSDPTNFILANGMVHFFANDGSHGTELWRSDGTAAGTVLVMDINPGVNGSLPSQPQPGLAYGTRLFLVADDGSHGPELWRFNVQAASTTGSLVVDLWPGAGNNPPQFLTRQSSASSMIFFAAWDQTHGQALWKIDGSNFTAFPVFAADPSPLTAEPTIDQITSIDGNSVFMVVDHPNYGRELWTFSGGEASLVRDVRPGPQSSNPQWLRPVDGAVCFSADDGVHGRELWVGAYASAFMVEDLTGDAVGSDPAEMTVLGTDVLFAATRADVGREFFAIDRSLVTSPIWPQWREANFPYGTAPELENPLADPDGDGENNLLEFVFGHNPRAADSRSVLQITAGPTPILSIDVTNDLNAAGLYAFLEYSSDPSGEWQWDPTEPTSLPLTPTISKLSWPVTVGSGKLFYRVRFSWP